MFVTLRIPEAYATKDSKNEEKHTPILIFKCNRIIDFEYSFAYKSSFANLAADWAVVTY